MVKIISIEGNIGSGKSTLVRNLKKRYPASDSGSVFVFLQEPVDEWASVVDSNGVGILENYYSDQKKYAFSFQMMAYISRLKQTMSAIKSNKQESIIITERSVYTDKNIFAKMLFDSGILSFMDYSIYNKWFDFFIEEVKIDAVIYVKTSPEVCLERINKRSRQGENIPIEYLIDCNKYHENWLTGNDNILVLDGNVEYPESDLPTKWIEQIEAFTK